MEVRADRPTRAAAAEGRREERVQFPEEIAMAARLFIAMIKNCSYDEPIDFEHIDSDPEPPSDAPPSSAASALAGTKRSHDGASHGLRKKARKSYGGSHSTKQDIIPNQSEVAVRVKDGGKFLWLLGQVLSYSQETKKYEVLDLGEDEDGSNSGTQKRYNVQRRNIRAITKRPNYSREKGSRVHALYPDTTVFYPATVKASAKSRDSRQYSLEFDEEDEDDSAKDVDAKYVIVLEETGR